METLVEQHDETSISTPKTKGATKAVFKAVLKKPYKVVKKQYTKHERKIRLIKNIITACLTIFDMISDVVLASNYYINGRGSWCFLTILFIFFPFLLAPILLGIAVCTACANRHQATMSNSEIFSAYWLSWKAIECVFESGPQLILQIY